MAKQGSAGQLSCCTGARVQVADLMKLHELTGRRLPIVFDFHHYRFCPGTARPAESAQEAQGPWRAPGLSWCTRAAGARPLLNGVLLHCTLTAGGREVSPGDDLWHDETHLQARALKFRCALQKLYPPHATSHAQIPGAALTVMTIQRCTTPAVQLSIPSEAGGSRNFSVDVSQGGRAPRRRCGPPSPPGPPSCNSMMHHSSSTTLHSIRVWRLRISQWMCRRGAEPRGGAAGRHDHLAPRGAPRRALEREPGASIHPKP